MPNDPPHWFPLANAPYHVMRKYDFSLARAVEFLADGLLRHPEFALCHCEVKPQPDQSLAASTEYVPLVCEDRAHVLGKFRHCAGTGRICYGSGLYVDLNELPALCQAEGLAIPPMFYQRVRICPAEPDTPLSDEAREQILDGLKRAGIDPQGDAAVQLLADIERAANWYLRTQIMSADFPDKTTARQYAQRLETRAESLRDLLTEMQIPSRGQTATHSEFRTLLREWDVELSAFEQTLARVAAAAADLRLRVDERMAGRGKPRDDAAERLACEIAGALRHAGITPTAYDDGPFEGYVLPAALEFVGAGAAGGRLHELAMLAVRDRPDG